MPRILIFFLNPHISLLTINLFTNEDNDECNENLYTNTQAMLNNITYAVNLCFKTTFSSGLLL